jgi:hypothetical protein
MRKLLLFVGLTLCNLFVVGQVITIDSTTSNGNPLNLGSLSSQSKLYKYSVGVKLFTIDQFPKILNDENSADFKELYLNSVFFKFNDNQINYRFTGSYYKDNITFNNECIDCEIVTGELTDFTIKTGFEKVLSYSTIQPYFGFDIGFRKNRFKGTTMDAQVSTFSAPYDIIAEKNGGVLSPVLGLNLNLVNHFTIGLETSMDVLFNYERQEKTSKEDSRMQTFKKDNNWEFLLRPVAVSLQYNFGSTD